jgi:hypothetical protein
MMRWCSSSSGRALELLDSRLRLAGSEVAELGEHDRTTAVQVGDRAIHDLVVKRGAAQEPPGAAQSRDVRPFAVALGAVDHNAVGVGERALAVPVRIPGEGAGALSASHHAAAVGSDRRVGPDRSGEPAYRLAADVARRRPISSLTSRSRMPAARSSSIACRAVSSVGNVLQRVVMSASP